MKTMRHIQAFTLVEVLVSSAVLAIVLAVMFAALSTSLSLWRNTDKKILADREARAVELLLVRDLANVVLPASADLWPTIASNSSGVRYLKFLTQAPPEYQSANSSEVGDICYVEYAVLPSTNGPGLEMRRLFWPSGRTYTNVLARGDLPDEQPDSEFQSLGLHLLPDNAMAARGLGALPQEVSNESFVLLGSDMLPFKGSTTLDNYPVAIEVNFAVADPDTLARTDLIDNPSYILRNAGLYSFRIPLPKPQAAQ